MAVSNRHSEKGMCFVTFVSFCSKVSILTRSREHSLVERNKHGCSFTGVD
jgi:hypothetical protein